MLVHKYRWRGKLDKRKLQHRVFYEELAVRPTERRLGYIYVKKIPTTEAESL
jgi:hypothetical protein